MMPRIPTLHYALNLCTPDEVGRVARRVLLELYDDAYQHRFQWTTWGGVQWLRSRLLVPAPITPLTDSEQVKLVGLRSSLAPPKPPRDTRFGFPANSRWRRALHDADAEELDTDAQRVTGRLFVNLLADLHEPVDVLRPRVVETATGTKTWAPPSTVLFRWVVESMIGFYNERAPHLPHIDDLALAVFAAWDVEQWDFGEQLVHNYLLDRAADGTGPLSAPRRIPEP